MYISYIYYTYILQLMTRSQQRPSWLSRQSVALDSRVREFHSHRRPWGSLTKIPHEHVPKSHVIMWNLEHVHLEHVHLEHVHVEFL